MSSLSEGSMDLDFDPPSPPKRRNSNEQITEESLNNALNKNTGAVVEYINSLEAANKQLSKENCKVHRQHAELRMEKYGDIRTTLGHLITEMGKAAALQIQEMIQNENPKEYDETVLSRFVQRPAELFPSPKPDTQKANFSQLFMSAGTGTGTPASTPSGYSKPPDSIFSSPPTDPQLNSPTSFNSSGPMPSLQKATADLSRYPQAAPYPLCYDAGPNALLSSPPGPSPIPANSCEPSPTGLLAVSPGAQPTPSKSFTPIDSKLPELLKSAGDYRAFPIPGSAGLLSPLHSISPSLHSNLARFRCPDGTNIPSPLRTPAGFVSNPHPIPGSYKSSRPNTPALIPKQSRNFTPSQLYSSSPVPSKAITPSALPERPHNFSPIEPYSSSHFLGSVPLLSVSSRPHVVSSTLKTTQPVPKVLNRSEHISYHKRYNSQEIVNIAATLSELGQAFMGICPSSLTDRCPAVSVGYNGPPCGRQRACPFRCTGHQCKQPHVMLTCSESVRERECLLVADNHRALFAHREECDVKEWNYRVLMMKLAKEHNEGRY